MRKLVVLPIVALSLAAVVLIAQGALVAVPAPDAGPAPAALAADTDQVTVATWQETAITRPRPSGGQTNPTVSTALPPQ
jgi:hypothetical protein